MAVIRAKTLSRFAGLREMKQWRAASHEIEDWANDLGKTVAWRDKPVADILYAGRSRFEIEDEVLATMFALRFG